ncbi:hypothetical protein FRB94_008221 [Tulasnella sp. JGI-2019a]|nr:hypothetical protein FRB94_008221 [Tulasnella sp. JGI-2019a]
MSTDTLQTAKVGLQILSTILNAVPIPEPFRSAVVGIPDAALKIITIVECTKGNVEDAKALAIYIATIIDRTTRPLDLCHVTPATQNRIQEFQDALRQIMEEITVLASRRSLRRWIVNYDRDASKLGALKQRVAEVIVGIQLETVVSTGHDVERLYQEQQVLIRKQQETEIDRLIATLGNADSGSSKKPPCLDGTRVSLLRWITRWIEQPLEEDRRGLCLIGGAGRGKSSVGASIARQEHKSKRLGGEFYFMVDQQDRNESVILVLARQLASWGDKRLRVEIASAVDEDCDITQRTLEVQFQKLIQEPLGTLAEDLDRPPIVILLDGLDEYDDGCASRLLRLIGQSFATLPAAVRFIITSRPEPHLLRYYDSPPFDTQLYIRSLDLEEVGEVERDIETFLKQELPRMVWGLVKKPSDWPGEERRVILIRLSGGLWIWIVTVARMLSDQNFRDPEKQLDALLSSTFNTRGEYGQITDLYAIYSRILNRACPSNSPSDLLALFHDVLGALCVLKVPVNIHTLASLLCLDRSNSEDLTDSMRMKVLGYLQAVLIVPDLEEDVPSRDAEPIRFIHKSFEDYLTDKSRCDARFLVDAGEEHRRMAIRCIRCMDELQKPNICNIDSTMLNSDIKDHSSGGRLYDVDKEEREGDNGIDEGRSDSDAQGEDDTDQGIKSLVRQHISSAMQYACESWVTHVSGAPPECEDIHQYVEVFARTRLLFWLEVLSLLGQAHTVIEMSEQVEAWLETKPPQVTPVQLDSPALPSPSLFHRFTMSIKKDLTTIWTGIRLRTLTALPSSGPLSLLDHVKSFVAYLLPMDQAIALSQASTIPTDCDISLSSLLHDLKKFVRVFIVPIRTSSPHIYYSALPFTPSHTALSRVYGHLAQGCPTPRRGCLQQWPQCYEQRCVAWSPDGQKIISGCDDGALRIWDSSTGALIGEAWRGHTGSVWALAWSPDGKMIVSGSDDGVIQLWDAATGVLVRDAWKGHRGTITSIAWLLDNKRFVTGSVDSTLRLWNPSTGSPVETVREIGAFMVRCVVRSPDSQRIASGSSSGHIHLWDSSTGAATGVAWKCHAAGVWALGWSPDGKVIVSGSMDGTIKLWDSTTGAQIGKVWKGHTAMVLSLAWSPDSKRIVSGSHDGTLRLWDLATETSVGAVWKGHADGVMCVAWSPDGRWIVSSGDSFPILWNSATGEPFRLGQSEPPSHTRHVYSIAFAPNSKRIVSASSDGTLRLWDSTSGVQVQHLVRPAAKASNLSFSLDDKYIFWEDDDSRTIWEAGEETELDGCSQLSHAPSNHVRILKFNDDGCLLDSAGKRMFWLPFVLRPMGPWGRVLAYRNTLVVETSSVPIIDISPYASRI